MTPTCANRKHAFRAAVNLTAEETGVREVRWCAKPLNLAELPKLHRFIVRRILDRVPYLRQSTIPTHLSDFGQLRFGVKQQC